MLNPVTGTVLGEVQLHPSLLDKLLQQLVELERIRDAFADSGDLSKWLETQADESDGDHAYYFNEIAIHISQLYGRVVAALKEATP